MAHVGKIRKHVILSHAWKIKLLQQQSGAINVTIATPFTEDQNMHRYGTNEMYNNDDKAHHSTRCGSQIIWITSLLSIFPHKCFCNCSFTGCLCRGESQKRYMSRKLQVPCAVPPPLLANHGSPRCLGGSADLFRMLSGHVQTKTFSWSTERQHSHIVYF